jgi:hypothetical protein
VSSYKVSIPLLAPLEILCLYDVGHMLGLSGGKVIPWMIFVSCDPPSDLGPTTCQETRGGLGLAFRTFPLPQVTARATPLSLSRKTPRPRDRRSSGAEQLVHVQRGGIPEVLQTRNAEVHATARDAAMLAVSENKLRKAGQAEDKGNVPSEDGYGCGLWSYDVDPSRPDRFAPPVSLRQTMDCIPSTVSKCCATSSSSLNLI